MDMVTIRVRANDHLITHQILRGKLRGNLQRQLRCDLVRNKGLDDVVALPPIQLAQLSLGVHHLLVLKAGITVQVGCEYLFLGLISVQNILDCLLQPTIPGQNFRDRHQSRPMS